jgi:hypothetical protein
MKKETFDWRKRGTNKNERKPEEKGAYDRKYNIERD